MLKWLSIIVRTLRSALRSRRELALENLVLRQQRAVLKTRYPRPRLTDADRLLWVVLSRFWSGWRDSLHVVQAETVVRWHRQGFRYYWRWESRGRGRAKIDPEIKGLIRRMCLSEGGWYSSNTSAASTMSRYELLPESCRMATKEAQAEYVKIRPFRRGIHVDETISAMVTSFASHRE